MKFIDEALITVQSGSGGRGCVSFRRERFIPRGGPDGGDGGKGGDVKIKPTRRKRTLYELQTKRLLRAENGKPGQGKCKTGKSGEDLVIETPPGTRILDADSGELIADLTAPGDVFVLLKGGAGGRGNTHFKTSTRQTPRFAQPGQPGQRRSLRLELKLLADVGIVGLPNAGKSTLIASISSARPKIADYPFTTLTPVLGVVETGRGEPFVMADIPGLIEGAHRGAGLGTRFLRHIERTRVLLHLIDASGIDPQQPLSGYRTLNRELSQYNDALAGKPQIVVLNKMDLKQTRRNAERFEQSLGGRRVMRISAATGEGIQELLNEIHRAIES